MSPGLWAESTTLVGFIALYIGMTIDTPIKEIGIYLAKGSSRPAAALLVSLGAAMMGFHLPAGGVFVCILSGWERIGGVRSNAC